jgi:hypothetical protein
MLSDCSLELLFLSRVPRCKGYYFGYRTLALRKLWWPAAPYAPETPALRHSCFTSKVRHVTTLTRFSTRVLSLLQHEDMFGDLEPLIVDQSLLTSCSPTRMGYRNKRFGLTVSGIQPAVRVVGAQGVHRDGQDRHDSSSWTRNPVVEIRCCCVRLLPSRPRRSEWSM